MKFSRVLPRPGVLSVLPAAVGVLSAVQFRHFQLEGPDAYHHMRVAALTREHGVLTRFPWWRFSIYRDHYADKEPLYHVLLVPFTFGDLRVGGKCAAVVFGVVFAACFLFVCRRLRAPWPWVWPLLLLAAGPIFLFRLSLCRPYVAGLTCFLLVLYFALRTRPGWVMVTSCLYGLTHSMAPLLLIVVIVSGTCRRVVTGRGNWSVVAAAVIGLALAALVHPNSPNNFVVQFIQAWSVPMARLTAPDFPLAEEMQGLHPARVISTVPLAVVCLAVGAIALVTGPRGRYEPLVLLCLSVFFLICTLIANRFIDFFCPVSVLFAAVAVRRPVGKTLPPHHRKIGAFAIALGATASGLWSLDPATDARTFDEVPAYRQAAEWIRENVPTGECVFTADWDDYPFLFFYDIDHTYLVGLDPMFMYAWDPEVYRTWDRLRHGRSERTFEEILEHFGTPVAVVTKDFRRLIEQARNDPRVAIPVDNEHLVVLDLRGVARPQARPPTDQPSTATHRPSDRIASGVRHGFSREWHEWERPIRVPHG